MSEKFSALAFATKRRGGNTQLSRLSAAGSVKDGSSEFHKWVEEIRSELVAAKGRTEEEKQLYSETLNRAILGFEDERSKLLAVIQDLLAKRRITDAPPEGRNYATLPEAIFAEIIGLNVLELVLKHREGLEEVQVVGRNIYEVRNGNVVPSSHSLSSIEELGRIQQNLVLFNNATLSPRQKWAEVMLQDGSRVTMTGFGFTAEPTLTIRFYTMKHFDLFTLSLPEFATMDAPMREVILCIIGSYFNMVVTGPTNSGKTNLIKAFIAEMNDYERIITIESRYELMLKRDFPNKNIVEYEVAEDDPQHSGEQAFKLALRQSPKRICHAEIRDEDANIYVRACTRGHEGSITSVHVNELEDVPDAIADMCMMDGRGMDSTRLTKRITQYVTQIGFEMALVNGKRKVVRIGEYAYEKGEVHVRDLMVYNDMLEEWEVVGTFSEQACHRISKHDRTGYMKMKELGLIDTR